MDELAVIGDGHLQFALVVWAQLAVGKFPGCPKLVAHSQLSTISGASSSSRVKQGGRDRVRQDGDQYATAVAVIRLQRSIAAQAV